MVKISFFSIFLLITLVGSSLAQQVAEPTKPAELNRQIERYHKALRSSPKLGGIFDKFYNSWLAEHSDIELESFLKEQTKSNNTADFQILALYQIRQGLEVPAIQTLKEALATAPKNANIHYQIGELFSQNLDFKQALKHINLAEKLSENDELNLKIAKAKGVILIRDNRHQEAIDHWKRLIEKNKQDNELIEDLIDLQLGENLPDEAISLSLTLIEQAKTPYKKALYKIKLAKIYDNVGKQEKAIALYTATLDSSGQSSWLEREIIAKIKEIYLREGNVNVLLEFYKTSITKYPNRIALRKEYADTLATQGNVSDAEKIYRDIIKLTPGDKTQIENLVNMLTLSEQPAKAKILLEQLIQSDTSNASYIIQLANLQHTLEDKQGLKQTLLKHYEQSKKGEDDHLKYARMLKKYDFKNEAQAQLATTHQKFPKSIKTKLALIDASISNKKPEITKQLCLQAAELASKEELLQISQKLHSSELTHHAIEILKSKLPQHKIDIGYVEQLCQFTLDSENSAQALPWALSLLHLAEKSSQINRVLKLCLKVIHQSSSEVAVTTKLASKSDLIISETCLLALLYENLDQMQKSNDLLDTLVKQQNLVGTIQASRIYEQRQQFPLAIATLEKAIKLPNGKKVVHLMKLSELHLRMGFIDKALSTIQLWKTIAPSDKLAWQRQIEILRRADRPEEALKQLRRTILKFPTDPELLQLLANIQQEMGNNTEMLATLWKIYQRSENNSEKESAISKLISAHKQIGDLSTMIGLLEKQHKNSPKSISIILGLAEAHKQQFEVEQARTYLLAASRLNPNDTKTLHLVADIDEEQNNIERAKAVLTKAIAIDKTPDSIKRLAQIYIEDNDLEHGIKMLKSLEQANNPIVITQIASALVKHQEFNEAYSYLEKSHAKFPNDWNILYQLVFLSHAFEKYDSLILYTKKLLLIKPSLIAKPGTKTSPSHSMINPFAPRHQRFQVYPNAPKIYSYAIEYTNNSAKIRVALEPFQQIFSIDRKTIKLKPLNPTDLTNAKSLALSHVIYLHQTSFKNDLESWTKKTKDIKHLHYTKLATQVISRADQAAAQELLGYEKNKLACYLIMAQSSAHNLTKDQLKEAIQILRPQFPIWSLQLKIRDAHLLSIEELLPLIKEIDTSALTLNQKINHLSRFYYRDEKIRTSLRLIFKSYQQTLLAQSPPTARRNLITIDLLLFREIYKDKDIEKIIDIINQRSGLAIKVPRLFTPLYPAHYESPISLQWPTSVLESVPHSVWDLLYENPNRYDFRIGLTSSQYKFKLRIPQEAITKHLDKIHSIPLRIHLLAAMDKDAEALALLKKSLQKTPYSMDLRMLAISHDFGEQSANTQTILKHFEATKNIQINRKKRLFLDILLLNQLHFISIDPKKSSVFAPTEFQQSALRRVSKKIQQSLHLTKIYAHLGMSDELKKQPFAKSKRPPRRIQKTIKVRSPEEIIATHMLNGKEKIAINYAVNAIKKYYFRDANNFQYRTSFILQKAKEYKIDDDIINALTPTEKSSLNQWVNYYDMMQQLNKPEQLILTRQYIMKVKEIPLQKRIQVAMIIMPDDSDRAITLLESIPEAQQIHSATAFNLTYRTPNLKNEHLIKHLQGFIKYVKTQQKKPFFTPETPSDRQNQIISQYLSILTHFIHSNSQPVDNAPPYLLKPTNTIKPTPLSLKRDALLDDLATILHTYPSSTDIAFRIMLKRKKDITEKEKLKLTSKTLSLYTNSTQVSYYTPRVKSRFSDTPHSIDYRQAPSAHHIAFDYLIKKPVLANLYFTPESLTDLAKRNKPIAEQIEQMRQLSKSKGKKLFEFIDHYYRKNTNLSIIRFAMQYNPLIIEELTTQYLGHIQIITNRIKSNSNNKDLQKKTEKLYDYQTKEALRYSLSIISEHLAQKGQASRWINTYKALISCDPKNINHMTSLDTLAGNSREHAELIKVLMPQHYSPEYQLPLLEIAKDYPDLLKHIRFHTPDISRSKPISYFKALGLLTTSKSIPFCQLTKAQNKNWDAYIKKHDKNNNPSYLGVRKSLILEIHKALSYSNKSVILKDLANVTDPKLKLSAVVTSCFLNPTGSNLIKHLEKNHTVLKQLTSDQKRAFINVLDLESKSNFISLKDTPAGKTLGITSDKFISLIKAEIEAFLKLDIYKGENPNSLIQENKQLIESVIQKNPKLAAKVFFHSIKLCKKHAYYKNDVANITQRITDNFQRLKISNWKAYFEFSLELLSHPSGKDYNAIRFLLSHSKPRLYNSNYKISPEYLKEFIIEASRYNGTNKQGFVDVLLTIELEQSRSRLDSLLNLLDKLDQATQKKHRRVISLIEKNCDFYKARYIQIPISKLTFYRSKPGLELLDDHRVDRLFLLDLFRNNQLKDCHIGMTDRFIGNGYSGNGQHLPFLYNAFEALERPIHILKYKSAIRYLKRNFSYEMIDPNRLVPSKTRELARAVVLDYLKLPIQLVPPPVSEIQDYLSLSLSDNNPESLIAYLKKIIINPNIAKLPQVQILCFKHGIINNEELDINAIASIETRFNPLNIAYDTILEERLAQYETSLKSDKEKYHLLSFTSALPDLIAEHSKLKENRQLRQLRLAKLIVKQNYSLNKKLITNLFHACSRWDLDTSQELKTYIDKLFTKSRIGSYAEKDLPYNLKPVIKHYFALKFINLEFDMLKNTMNQLTSNEQSFKILNPVMKKAITEGVTIAMVDCIRRKDYKKLKQILPIARQLAELGMCNWKKPGNYSYPHELHSAMHLGLVSALRISHFLCGKKDDYILFRESFKSRKAKVLFTRFETTHGNDAYELTKPYVLALLQYEPNRILFNTSEQSEIIKILEKRAFTPEELLKVISNHPYKPIDLFKQKIHQAQIYEILGDTQSSLRSWEQAIELAPKYRNHDSKYTVQHDYIVAKYHQQNLDRALEAINAMNLPMTIKNKNDQLAFEKLHILKNQLLYLKKNPVK